MSPRTGTGVSASGLGAKRTTANASSCVWLAGSTANAVDARTEDLIVAATKSTT
jgi:hypothetical protein